MLKYIKQNLTKDKLLNMSGACYWRIGLCGNPSKYCYNLTKKKNKLRKQPLQMMAQFLIAKLHL